MLTKSFLRYFCKNSSSFRFAFKRFSSEPPRNSEAIFSILNFLKREKFEKNEIENFIKNLEKSPISNEKLLYKIFLRMNELKLIHDKNIFDKIIDKISAVKFEENFKKTIDDEFFFKIIESYEENQASLTQKIEEKLLEIALHKISLMGIDSLIILFKNLKSNPVFANNLLSNSKVKKILEDNISFFSLSLSIDMSSLLDLLNSMSNNVVHLLELKVFDLIDMKLKNNKYKDAVLNSREFNLLLEITERTLGNTSETIWNKLIEYLKHTDEKNFPSIIFLIKLLSLNYRNKFDLDSQTLENIEKYINKHIVNFKLVDENPENLMFIMIYNGLCRKEKDFFFFNRKNIEDYLSKEFNQNFCQQFLINENYVFFLQFINNLLLRLSPELKSIICSELDCFISEKVLTPNQHFNSLKNISNILHIYCQILNKTDRSPDDYLRITKLILNYIDPTRTLRKERENEQKHKIYDIQTLSNLINTFYLIKSKMTSFFPDDNEKLNDLKGIEYFFELLLKKSYLDRTVPIIKNPIDMIDFISLGKKFEIKGFTTEIFNKVFPRFAKDLTLSSIRNLHNKIEDDMEIHYLMHSYFLKVIQQAEKDKELDFHKINHITGSFLAFSSFLEDKRAAAQDFNYLQNMTEIFHIFQEFIFQRIIQNYHQGQFKLNVFEKIEQEKQKKELKKKKDKSYQNQKPEEEEEQQYVFSEDLNQMELNHLVQIFESYQQMNVGSKALFSVFRRFFLKNFDKLSFPLKIKWLYCLAESNRLNEEIIKRAEVMVLEDKIEPNPEETFKMLWFFLIANNLNEEVIKKIYEKMAGYDENIISSIDQNLLVQIFLGNTLLKLERSISLPVLNYESALQNYYISNYKINETKFLSDIGNYMHKEEFTVKKNPILYDNVTPIMRLPFELANNHYIFVVDRNGYLSNTKLEKGETVIKRKILQLLKTKVRIMEFYEWIRLSKRHEKNTYYKNKLKAIENKEPKERKYYYNY